MGLSARIRERTALVVLPLLCAVTGGLVLCVPASEARLIAAISQNAVSDPLGIGNTDIRLIDPLDTTPDPGDPALQLHPQVTTGALEFDVSMSSDGRWLTFRRDNRLDDSLCQGCNLPADGRFIVDRSRSLQSPFAVKPIAFSGFDFGQTAVLGNLEMTPDARRLIGLSSTVPVAGVFDLDPVPLPAASAVAGANVGFSATLTDPKSFDTAAVSADGRFAWWVSAASANLVVIRRADGTGSELFAPFLLRAGSFGQPRITLRPGSLAFSPLSPSLLVYTHRIAVQNGTGRSDLGELRLSPPPAKFGRLDVFLEGAVPGITNAQETHPRWSPDGRYLVWLDITSASQRKMKVFDRSTQALVNEGHPLGARDLFFDYALAQTPPLVESLQAPQTLTSDGTTLQARLREATSVGILVQRITGRRMLFGRSAPRLQTVGRVPLGARRKGGVRIRWDGRVNGRRLAPGRYQITMRTLEGGSISDLSKPVVVRVR